MEIIFFLIVFKEWPWCRGCASGSSNFSVSKLLLQRFVAKREDSFNRNT